MISTKSERKPLKSTIWLTDQITRKFKNRSLQNFQTWQFTSLSFRKQQRNGLNGTAKSLNCFLTWEEKKSFVVFCWLAKFIAEKVCCVVLLKDRSLKIKKRTEFTHYPLARRWILLNSSRWRTNQIAQITKTTECVYTKTLCFDFLFVFKSYPKWGFPE